MVLVHGFTDTWRTWDLVLPALEERHDILAPTLSGHAGGPPLTGEPTGRTLADGVERAMDEAGFDTAHLVGNSLGGFVALQLAERGRARSVVALAPSGGWRGGDAIRRATIDLVLAGREASRMAAPFADVIAATDGGRRRATEYLARAYRHIPAELIAHQIVGSARCDGAEAIARLALRADNALDGSRITCPVLVVWGTADRVLQYPAAAEGFREWLPQAEWVTLDGVAHCPQLDVPGRTARLILDFASSRPDPAATDGQ